MDDSTLEERQPLTGVKGAEDPKAFRRQRYAKSFGLLILRRFSFLARSLAVFTSLLTMFLGSVMFSITLPSMVFFYDIVEGTVTQETCGGKDAIKTESIGFYGLIVAAFSLGQVRWNYAVGKLG